MSGSGSRYEGKIAVVTGAASGIGLATTRRLLAEGASVVGGDINEEGLAAVAQELGTKFIAQTTDVSREGDVAALVKVAVEDFGGLDAAFNVAGIGDLAYIVDLTEETWDSVMSVTLKGAFFSVKHEARAMIAQQRPGAIVNVASVNCRMATDGLVAYATAKAGIEMLTKSAAVELGRYGIRVNAVSPGIVMTPATAFFTGDKHAVDVYTATIPLGRFGQPEDIAGAATFLASDDALWISGANLFIDGAESLTGFPSLMEHVAGVSPPVSHVS